LFNGINYTFTYFIAYYNKGNSSDNWGGSILAVYKKACNSVRREVLYNIHFEFGKPVKIVKLIKICLNETCSEVHLSKDLSDAFAALNGLMQGYLSLPLTCALKSKKKEEDWMDLIGNITLWCMLMMSVLGVKT
jgi:hypothetical protein